MTRKLLLIGLALAILLFFVWKVGTETYLAPVQQNYEISKRLLDTNQALLARMENEERTKEQLEEELNELEVYLPFEEEANQLLESLNELQQGLDVDITQVVKLPAESNIEAEGLSVMQSVFQVEVDYTNLNDFRQLIEDFTTVERTISLQSLNYDNSNTGTGSGTFVIRTYYQGNNQVD
jgi:Tfp pilus assembly protein PilO